MVHSTASWWVIPFSSLSTINLKLIWTSTGKRTREPWAYRSGSKGKVQFMSCDIVGLTRRDCRNESTVEVRAESNFFPPSRLLTWLRFCKNDIWAWFGSGTGHPRVRKLDPFLDPQRPGAEKKPISILNDHGSNTPCNPNIIIYNFSLFSLIIVAYMTLNSLLNNLPEAVLGIASINCTPPVKCYSFNRVWVVWREMKDESWEKLTLYLIFLTSTNFLISSITWSSLSSLLASFACVLYRYLQCTLSAAGSERKEKESLRWIEYYESSRYFAKSIIRNSNDARIVNILMIQ